MKLNYQRLTLVPVALRVAIFLVTLLLLWLPLAAPLYLLLRRDSNLATIVTMSLMFVVFLVILPWWGKLVYQQPHIYRHYGLSWSQANRLAWHRGLTIGVLFTFTFFVCQSILGWVEFQPSAASLPRLVIEGFFSGVGIAFAEELFFRGWLLDELQRDYTATTAMWLNGLVFAFLHFLKPLPEMIQNLPAFPGLIMLGITLVWAKHQGKGQLGLPMGIHGGLVWSYYILSIGEFFNYTGKVPLWVSGGVGGNPLAGLMGLGGLIFLVIAVKLSNK